MTYLLKVSELGGDSTGLSSLGYCRGGVGWAGQGRGQGAEGEGRGEGVRNWEGRESWGGGGREGGRRNQ